MPQLEEMRVEVTLPDGTPYAGKYELRFGDCTGLDDLAVRKETGYTIIGLLNEVQKDNGLTLTFACVVAWLVRRQQFPHVTFEMIAKSVPWGSDFKVDLPDTEVEEDPEGKADSGPETPESSPPSRTSTTSRRGTSTV